MRVTPNAIMKSANITLQSNYWALYTGCIDYAGYAYTKADGIQSALKEKLASNIEGKLYLDRKDLYNILGMDAVSLVVVFNKNTAGLFFDSALGAGIGLGVSAIPIVGSSIAVNVIAGGVIGVGISKLSDANYALEITAGQLKLNGNPEYNYMGKAVNYLIFETAQYYSIDIDTNGKAAYTVKGQYTTRMIPITGGRGEYLSLVTSRLGYDGSAQLNVTARELWG